MLVIKAERRNEVERCENRRETPGSATSYGWFFERTGWILSALPTNRK